MTYVKVIPVLHVDDRTPHGNVIVHGAKTRFIATITAYDEEIYILKSKRDEHGRIPSKYLKHGICDETLGIHGANKLSKEEIIGECMPCVEEMFPDFCESIKYGDMREWTTER